MKISARLLSGVTMVAFALAGMLVSPAMAQDKGKDAKAAPAKAAPAAAKAEKGAATMKVLTENDKVKVYELTFKPGDENKAVPSSSYRVIRAIKGGTITRTYADGKTEKVEYKVGDVKYLEPSKSTYTGKNTGKTEVELYVVLLK